LSKAISLRAVCDADVPLLTSWLHKAHVRKWYGDPADWLAEINGRQEGFAWIHHFIVIAEGIPIGFGQYYDCFDAKEEWYAVPLRGVMYSIDYLIGEESYLGCGYGKAVIACLTDAVRQSGAEWIVVQPDAENTASCRALVANGYAFDFGKAYYQKHLQKEQ